MLISYLGKSFMKKLLLEKNFEKISAFNRLIAHTNNLL